MDGGNVAFELSEETVEKMLSFMMEEHPTCIRFDPERITKEEIKARLKEDGVEKVEDHPVLPYALWISGYDYLAAWKHLKKDCFMCRMQVHDGGGKPAVKKGDSIIDVCAAPGGKALHAAEKLAGTGHVGRQRPDGI